MSTRNRTVVVTGAGSGIGRAVALAFAAQGATVVGVGRTLATLDETAEEVRRAGGLGHSVVADLVAEGGADQAIRRAVELAGSPGVSVNAAGVVGRGAPLADFSPAEFRSVMDANVFAVWASMCAELAVMKAGSSIINVSSIIGPYARRAGMSLYGASKAAVSTLTRTAAREYVGAGIRINAVSPGATDTALSYRAGETREDRDRRVQTAVPAGRVASTAEIADAVTWLASEGARFVIGQEIVIDGGATA